MRLALRLLTLALLLSIASFTSLVSQVSYASPCTDGCGYGVTRCRQNCPVTGTCEQKCADEFEACMAKCAHPAFEE